MRRGALAVAAVAVALATLSPAPAGACGGCFSPPGRALILQDAERVLFHSDPATRTTRVWVEIKYNGPASKFGWVLPVPALPKVGVGSSYVFDRLDQAAAPRFVTRLGSTDENCHDPVSGEGGCALGGMASDERAAGSVPLAAPNEVGADGGDGVKILEHAQAGPYDYSIIASADSVALLDWLGTNGFDTPATAKPIIEAHLKRGDVFVAVSLVSGASVKEIRPITLEMHDVDPCVPLRLTSIAAVDDLHVVVYLLGPGRAVPKNLMHVVLNPLKLRWDGGVNNYPQVLSAAIDEAAGRAFVTEFAGSAKQLRVPPPVTDSNVDAVGLFNQPIAGSGKGAVGAPVSGSPWKAGELFDKTLLDISPLQQVQTVSDLITVMRTGRMILVQDSAAVLEKVTGLAAKMGRSADVTQFWLDLRSRKAVVSDSLGVAPIDGAALYKEMKEAIIDPVYDVAGMLTSSATLTRLAMRISPREMDRDPLFAFNKDLPDVPNLHTAELHGVCPGGDYDLSAYRLTVEGGGSYIVQGRRAPLQFGAGAVNKRTELVTSTAEDPRWRGAPAALRVEVLDGTGPPRTVPEALIDQVDGLIAASVPGAPTLPAGAPALDQTEKRWTPPRNDPPRGPEAGGRGRDPRDGRLQPRAEGLPIPGDGPADGAGGPLHRPAPPRPRA